MPVGAADGAHNLLGSFQDFWHAYKGTISPDAPDRTHIQDLKLQEFLHDGVKVQGVSTNKLIKKGDTVVLGLDPLSLRIEDEFKNLPEFKHIKDDYEKLGFWLAQSKHDYVDHLPHDLQLSRFDRLVLQYIRSLPPLSEYRSQGMPLAASYADLHKLDGLPHLGTLSKSVDQQRETLLDDWAEYSKAKGSQPKFGYADALWGVSVARSRGYTFPGSRSVKLLPVSDMPNLGADGNVVIAEPSGPGSEDIAGVPMLRATKDIKPGEEVLLSYGNGQQTSGPDLLAKHGFFEGGSKATWSAEECAQIRKALPADGAGKSKMLQAVDKLVQQSCSSAAKGAPEKLASMSDSAKEPSAMKESADAPSPPQKMDKSDHQSKVGTAIKDEAEKSASEGLTSKAAPTKFDRIDEHKVVKLTSKADDAAASADDMAKATADGKKTGDKSPAEQTMNPIIALVSPTQLRSRNIAVGSMRQAMRSSRSARGTHYSSFL